MIKPVNTPAYVDKYSGLKDVQIETINTIVRTMYNRFIGKINQEQLKDTPASKNTVRTSWRITNLQDWNYAGAASLSFDFDTSGMIEGNEYKIISLLPTNIKSKYLYQTGLSNLSSTESQIDKNKERIFSYGSFYLKSVPEANEYFIIYKCSKPSETNWRVTLGFYTEE